MNLEAERRVELGRVTAEKASWILVAVTALWGISFTWTRQWQLAAREFGLGELLSSLTLIGIRIPLALVLLGLWQPATVWKPTWREYLGGLQLGTVFWVGFLLQTWGLASTTPALSAFFTSLCSAWVPVLAYVCFRERVPMLTLLGLGLALVGCGVLVDGWRLGRGEWLTMVASVLFAVQVLVLDRLGRKMEPAHLSAGFLLATGVLSLVGAVLLAGTEEGIREWWGKVWVMLSQGEILRDVLCLAVFPTVLGFHWMNTYQPLVPASRAALIYLLEPVFSLLVSALWGHDRLTGPLLAGAGLILGGNVLVELPRLLRRGEGGEGR